MLSPRVRIRLNQTHNNNRKIRCFSRRLWAERVLWGSNESTVKWTLYIPTEYLYHSQRYNWPKRRTLKPIFHRKLHSCWLPKANEIDTNNMKFTCPTQNQLSRTQHEPYSTISRWGLRWTLSACVAHYSLTLMHYWLTLGGSLRKIRPLMTLDFGKRAIKVL